MPQLITMGETMVGFVPSSKEPLRYVTEYTTKIAGAESNLAIGVRKLGHSAGWISKLGDDEFGHLILNRVRGEGIDVSQVKFDDSRPSGIMFKDKSLKETKIFYYRENSAACNLSPDDIEEDYIASAEVLHLTGITPVLSENCRLAVETTVQYARKHHVDISFDPNIRLKMWGKTDYTDLILRILKQSGIVLLGLSEAKILLQSEDIDEIFRTIFAFGAAKYVAVKDGARGAWVSDGHEPVHCPPVDCESIDPVGAGDAFNAGFISGILDGRPVETCGEMGNIMGGMATQSLGDFEGLPSKEDMQNYLSKRSIVYR